MAPQPSGASREEGCIERDLAEPEAMCGASVAVHGHCLAHLTPGVLATYLATLVPGSDLNVRGVTFTAELLAEILDALRDDRNIPQIRKADFRGAMFSEDADFGGAMFSGNADFGGTRFSGGADFAAVEFSRHASFRQALFSGSADFDGATFQSASFSGATFSMDAGFLAARFSGDAEFFYATFSGNAGFNAARFSRTVGFTGTVFSEDAAFNGAGFSERARFSGMRFSREVSFSGATFSEYTQFNGTSFSGQANFGKATFSENADFEAVTFHGDAVFTGAAFLGDALFLKTNISEKADFSWAMFSKNALFGNATFSDDTIFVQVKIFGIAFFAAATFLGRAWFNGSAESLLFDGAAIGDELTVQAATRSVSAQGMRAQQRVSLRLRAATVNLSDAVSTGPMTIHGLQQPIPRVDESRFIDPGTRQLPGVSVVSLRGVDADPLVLTDVDLSGCQFAGMHCADQLRMDGRCTFATDPRGRRRVLAEEHHWRATRPSWWPRRPGSTASRWIRASDELEVVGPARLEALYRQLRKALEDSKNEPSAADFYYGEMEMRRNTTGPRHERLLLTLYWLVSGYGLRASRALVSLAVVVALLAVGMKYAGFPGGRHPAYLDTLLYSLRAAFSLDVKTAALPENVTRWGQVIRIVLRIAGPLFVGLAALAIRNRVKR